MCLIVKIIHDCRRRDYGMMIDILRSYVKLVTSVPKGWNLKVLMISMVYCCCTIGKSIESDFVCGYF